MTVYAFGERWPTESNIPDKVFGFLPGNGVHDVHMNQGNTGRFVRDDGVWQDGGLLLHFGQESRWVAIFLAFKVRLGTPTTPPGTPSRAPSRDRPPAVPSRPV